MTVIEILVLVVATYRLVRLVTTDVLLEPFRMWAEGRSLWLGYLVSCDWCLSIWVGSATTAIALEYGDVPVVRWAGIALAVSAAVGLLAALEQRLDR